MRAQPVGPAQTSIPGTEAAARLIASLRGEVPAFVEAASADAGSTLRILVAGASLASEASVRRGLEAVEGAVTPAMSGADAVAAAARGAWDLVLLDTDLPDMPGIDTCRKLRAQSDMGVIFVSAQDALPVRLQAFDAGADDYLVRPVAPAELERRMRAVLRRTGLVPRQPQHVAGPAGVALDMRAHEARVAGVPVAVTPREFELLQLLLLRAGTVLSPDEIATQIWGYETFGAPNFVEAHISRLRSKLARAGAPGVIRTVRGAGYIVRAQPAAGDLAR